MDPCPFVRILVSSFSLRLPNRQSSSSNSSFTCNIKLVAMSSSFPVQTAKIPLVISKDSVAPDTCSSQSLAACFELDKAQIDKLLLEKRPKGNPCLEISIYQDSHRAKAGSGMCGLLGSGTGGRHGKFLGKATVPVPVPMPELMDYLRRGEPRGLVIHNGWVNIRADDQSEEVFVTARVESDPRFMFEFEKEPECSPQVFQAQGNVKQPVFTCKFSCRNSATERNLRSISGLSEPGTSQSCLSLRSGDRDQQAKERKGWSITIHDLSGSPVAAASMVTPFVQSPGTDRVSRSNPGAWLILRPGHNTWNPWGRLEAWRERAGSGILSYRFELLSDTAASPSTATPVAVGSSISIRNGGKFVIDTTANLSPVASPSSSMDFGSGSWSGSGSSATGSGFGSPWPNFHPKGFVMSSTMQGVDKASRPKVEVGVQHVTCTEDAAVFVALAAAMDLSMDACRLFSQKLREELRQSSQEFVL